MEISKEQKQENNQLYLETGGQDKGRELW